MKVRIKSDRVLIKRDEHETDGRGLSIVDGVIRREKPPRSGTVVAVGPGIKRGETRIPCNAQVGDHVWFEDDRGTEMDFGPHGPHLLIRDKFILFAD